jgi:uncharacterized protein YcbK (DUF882 family)
MLVTLPVARPTEADLPTQRASGHATRKEWASELPTPTQADEAARAADDAGGDAVPTWATLFNVHTGEAMPLSSEEPTQDRFCDSLSDRTTASRINLDPRLLELLRQVAIRNPGARIELVSGFRSPKLNEMLRKKGHHVASHSQHSLGHAVDFRIIGFTPAKMKKEILKIGWEGGIGQYDGPSDLFVHADVGPKREWFEK